MADVTDDATEIAPTTQAGQKGPWHRGQLADGRDDQRPVGPKIDDRVNQLTGKPPELLVDRCMRNPPQLGRDSRRGEHVQVGSSGTMPWSVVIPTAQRCQPGTLGRDDQREYLVGTGDVSDDGWRVHIISEQSLDAGQTHRPLHGSRSRHCPRAGAHPPAKVRYLPLQVRIRRPGECSGARLHGRISKCAKQFGQLGIGRRVYRGESGADGTRPLEPLQDGRRRI